MVFKLTIAMALSALIAPSTKLSYDEGVQTPKNLTTEEIRYIEKNPITVPRGATPPPVGPVHCVAEYEPMEAILLAWEGGSSWENILAEMAASITTIGDADVIIAVDSTSEQSGALTKIANYGGNTTRVRFLVRSTDTIWIRDYGPRYIYEGDCRAIVDHTYNRPRPNDNGLNEGMANYMHHKLYELPLVHGGGNFHLNANDLGWATELIEDENSGLSSSQIRQHWLDYQNLDVTITDAYPTSVDSTQHIDMWMCWASDNTCVISDWPNNVGSTQDNICDSMASTLQSQGYTVVRTPARSISWTHYTYANSVICNDLVLVPSYTNSSVSQHNEQAIAAWQQACPDKTIVSVPCQNIVTSAGVMHCICMHIPKHKGGLSPTMYLQTPNGGEEYDPADLVPITWISDDNQEVISVDIHFSADNGISWDAVEINTSDDGFYIWQVPDVNTSNGQLRITGKDSLSNSGNDFSDLPIIINGSNIPGDVNGDGLVNVTDLLAIVDAWGACNSCDADLNDDGIVNVVDLLIVLDSW